MLDFSLYDPSLPVTAATRRRHWFSILGLTLCVGLVAWGGFVTSIDAGLAVPDWPTSFGSYDPIATGYVDEADPASRWWHHVPILAEHGHRLFGAILGLWVLAFAVWTWRVDVRHRMRNLGFAALGLVTLQGILGGLRVVWQSADLAVVHAMGAQFLFALLLAMTLFTAPSWLRGVSIQQPTRKLRGLSVATAVAICAQILLGAILRHPGAGVHLGFATIHIAGALLVVGLILATCAAVRSEHGSDRVVNRTAWVMMGAVGLQVTLGFAAFAVLLVESRLAERSMLQVVLNSAHLVVGTLLFGASVCLMLFLARRTDP